MNKTAMLCAVGSLLALWSAPAYSLSYDDSAPCWTFVNNYGAGKDPENAAATNYISSVFARLDAAHIKSGELALLPTIAPADMQEDVGQIAVMCDKRPFDTIDVVASDAYNILWRSAVAQHLNSRAASP